VELSVFPSDLSRVHVGQQVKITNSGASVSSEGKIITVSPVGSSANQTTTARVLLDNSDRQWYPGHFVSAEVVLSETEVPTAVRDSAIQIVEDQSVVFVAADEGFEARPVTLGRGDGQFSEVLKGLNAGESYVSANSFILKSELGKEDAEHGH
jgi:cobalt-zinc-cadmium efflux system membrane fusion protein